MFFLKTIPHLTFVCKNSKTRDVVYPYSLNITIWKSSVRPIIARVVIQSPVLTVHVNNFTVRRAGLSLCRLEHSARSKQRRKSGQQKSMYWERERQTEDYGNGFCALALRVGVSFWQLETYIFPPLLLLQRTKILTRHRLVPFTVLFFRSLFNLLSLFFNFVISF